MIEALASALLGLVSLGWVASATPLQRTVPQAPDATTMVTCTEIAFSDAAERRERDAFAGFLDPDARFISRSVSRGPDAVLTAWAAYFEPNGPSIRWRPHTVEVNGDGTLALSRGPYRVITVAADGERQERWGTFISVWRLGNDGRWRVQFDTGADDGTEPSENARRLLEQSQGIDESKCRNLPTR